MGKLFRNSVWPRRLRPAQSLRRPSRWSLRLMLQGNGR